MCVGTPGSAWSVWYGLKLPELSGTYLVAWVKTDKDENIKDERLERLM